MNQFIKFWLAAALLSFTFYSLNHPFPPLLHFKGVLRPPPKRVEPAPFLVLIFGPPDTGSWVALPPFGNRNCPCYFTDDQNQIESADAIAFVAIKTSGNYSELPPPKIQKFKPPQLRVFVQLESPQRMYGNDLKHLANNDQFNWTMTYRRDSDVSYLLYGETIKKSESNITASEILDMANHNLDLTPQKLELYKKLYLQNKTKGVAWVVSNCETMSRREDFVAELKKFMKIDIYGKCGNFECPDNCKEFIGKNYKFYLAFENSLCHDYVTEKYFNALENNVLPIVYGGANYSLLGPPGSFVNSMDFSSVRELAQYINYLDENPREYLKYFLWKEHYQIRRQNGWCTLCKKMVEHSTVKLGKFVLAGNYSNVHKNISAWLYFKPGNGQVPACQQPPKSLIN